MPDFNTQAPLTQRYAQWGAGAWLAMLLLLGSALVFASLWIAVKAPKNQPARVPTVLSQDYAAAQQVLQNVQQLLTSDQPLVAGSFAIFKQSVPLLEKLAQTSAQQAHTLTTDALSKSAQAIALDLLAIDQSYGSMFQLHDLSKSITAVFKSKPTNKKPRKIILGSKTHAFLSAQAEWNQQLFPDIDKPVITWLKMQDVQPKWLALVDSMKALKSEAVSVSDKKNQDLNLEVLGLLTKANVPYDIEAHDQALTQLMLVRQNVLLSIQNLPQLSQTTTAPTTEWSWSALAFPSSVNRGFALGLFLLGAGLAVLFLNQSVRSSRLGRIDEQWLQWAVQVESGLDQIKQPTAAFQQKLEHMQQGLHTLQQHIDQTAEVFDRARTSTQLDAHSWSSLTQSQNHMVQDLQSMQQALLQLQLRFAQGGDAIDVTYRMNHVIDLLNRVAQAATTTQTNLELMLQRAPQADEPGIHASVQQWNEEIQRLNRSGAELQKGFQELHLRLDRLSSHYQGSDHVL